MSYGYGEYVNLSKMLGRVFVKIDREDESVTFHCDDGSKFVLAHEQDCCETVYLESVTGELDDLLNNPILKADENYSSDFPADVEVPSFVDSVTWSFYDLATIKGTVTLRWYGESNGYYGETATLRFFEGPSAPMVN